MSPNHQTITVAEAARQCAVGYWIRSEKLHANRVGRSYRIPVEGLVFFLKSTGQKVPLQLVGENPNFPVFRTTQNCWEYWQGSNHNRDYRDCTVYLNQASLCFTARDSSRLGCHAACAECKYYLEMYLPRIGFIHQIDFPAAVYRDLYIWGGNGRWAELCNVL